MKLSNIIIASLVLASLSGAAHQKPKEGDKPKEKTTAKKTEPRKTKKDSVRKNTPEPESKREHWNCPPCGMG